MAYILPDAQDDYDQETKNVGRWSNFFLQRFFVNFLAICSDCSEINRFACGVFGYVYVNYVAVLMYLAR